MRRMLCIAVAALLISRCAGAKEERRMAELPQGLPMVIVLQTTLDSRTSQVGQPVQARLAAPISAEGTVVVPQGAELAGEVTAVTGPQMGVMKAKINFILTRMRTPSGTVPIHASAHLDIKDLATKGGKAAGGMAAKEVVKRAIPVLGTVFLIQDVAKGVQFVTEEKEITIPAGTQMTLHLDKDVRVPII